jgi:hypothetical protein
VGLRRLVKASGPVLTGAESLALTGIRSPDCLAHDGSLYRMRYPVPPMTVCRIYHSPRCEKRFTTSRCLDSGKFHPFHRPRRPLRRVEV